MSAIRDKKRALSIAAGLLVLAVSSLRRLSRYWARSKPRKPAYNMTLPLIFSKREHSVQKEKVLS
jgi:hypothetical protein